MELFYTIDRFDDSDWAILEDEDARTFGIPRKWLPSPVREGDVIKIVQYPAESGSSLLRVEIDATARAQRLGEVGELRQQLRRGPKGDVSL